MCSGQQGRGTQDSARCSRMAVARPGSWSRPKSFRSSVTRQAFAQIAVAAINASGLPRSTVFPNRTGYFLTSFPAVVAASSSRTMGRIRSKSWAALASSASSRHPAKTSITVIADTSTTPRFLRWLRSSAARFSRFSSRIMMPVSRMNLGLPVPPTTHVPQQFFRRLSPASPHPESRYLSKVGFEEVLSAPQQL